MQGFNANKFTFEEGLKKIRDALAKHHMSDIQSKIVTSKDPGVDKVLSDLETKNVPSGFKKWQLPVYQDGPTQLFISVGAPNADVPEHSHDEGDGFRYVASGSILYKGHELSAGDWMFIPKAAKYSIKIGKMGATMFYCHQCCCG